jgi:hypothetical protein
MWMGNLPSEATSPLSACLPVVMPQLPPLTRSLQPNPLLWKPLLPPPLLPPSTPCLSTVSLLLVPNLLNLLLLLPHGMDPTEADCERTKERARQQKGK